MKLTSLVLLLSSLLSAQIIRVNAGGPSYVDSGGRTWEADNYYSGGVTFSSIIPLGNITGTSDPTLYMTGRTDPSAFSYAFPLADGIYQVTLKFADVLPVLTTPRLFNVIIQGKTVLSQFNLTALAGRGAAYDRSFNTIVLGNSPLTIVFSQVSGAPIIQAIEILYLYTVPSGDTLPATCSIGQFFVKTNAATSQKIYVCETLNTWVQQIGSSASMTTGAGVPSGACTAGGLYANITPSPHDFYGCGPSATWQRFIATNDSGDGKVCLQGVVSGQACIAVPDSAGAPKDLLLPISDPTVNQVWTATVIGAQIQTGWSTPSSTTVKVPVTAPSASAGADPADSTTYFWAPNASNSTTACASLANYYGIVSPVTGTITDFFASATIAVTLGSSENVTYTLLKNCTATTLTMTQQWTSASPAVVSDSAHTASVTKGDLLQLRIVTPAWVTNPTNTVVGPWGVSITLP